MEEFVNKSLWEYNDHSKGPIAIVELVNGGRHPLDAWFAELLSWKLLRGELLLWCKLLLGIRVDQSKHVSLEVVELALVFQHLDDMILFFFSALAVYWPRVLTCQILVATFCGQLGYSSLLFLNGSLLAFEISLSISNLGVNCSKGALSIGNSSLESLYLLCKVADVNGSVVDMIDFAA